MEWLINTLQEYWVEITTSGALGLIAIKTFVLDAMSSKKNNKAISALFGATTTIKSDVDKTMKSEVTKMLKGSEVLFEQLGEFKAVFESVVSEIKDLKIENATLVNLLVQSFTYLNVPLEQKKDTFNALKSISSINDTVLKSLEVSIAKSETKATETRAVRSDIKEKINRI